MNIILKPYSEYRDSALPWLGKIPTSWDLRRTKYLFQERSEKGFPNEPLLAATQTKGVVPKSLYDNRTVLATKDLHLLKLVEVGDYVISLRSFQGGIEVAHYRGIISPAYTVLAPFSSARHEYFDFLLKSQPFIDSLSLYITGIREGQNIDYERLSRAQFPHPPEEEQIAIGHFLRKATFNIGRLIRAKQKFISLLNEQKQSLVHRVITRGIDPDVHLKASGIEWIGKVPEHWTVMPLKRAFKSMDYGISDPGTDDGCIRVLGMGNIRDGRVSVPVTGGVNQVDPSLLLRAGDLLFNRTNSAELVGKVGLFIGFTTDTTFASYLVRLRAASFADPEYLNYLLNSPAILRTARQLAIPSLHQSNLNPSRYGRIQIALPPLREQKNIAARLRSDLREIELSIEKVKREIDLLRAYRTRLVADVVTGKLDVRGTYLPEIDITDVAEVVDEVEADEIEDSSDVDAAESSEGEE